MILDIVSRVWKKRCRHNKKPRKKMEVRSVEDLRRPYNSGQDGKHMAACQRQRLTCSDLSKLSLGRMKSVRSTLESIGVRPVVVRS